MAEVMVSIGGREYRLSCREGEQAKLLRLAERVDAKTNMARSAVGDTTEPRLLLFASLFLADEIEEMLQKPQTPGGDGAEHANDDASMTGTGADTALIERIDAIGARLTKMTASLAAPQGAPEQAGGPRARNTPPVS